MFTQPNKTYRIPGKLDFRFDERKHLCHTLVYYVRADSLLKKQKKAEKNQTGNRINTLQEWENKSQRNRN